MISGVIHGVIRPPVRGYALNTGGGGVRTLDVAGSELVTNAQFTSNITGWSDASSAGGSVAYNSGKLRALNSTGTARGRQAVTVVSGARHAAIVEAAVGSTIGGTIALGSGAAGSSDYLSKSLSAAANAQVGMAEFTATSAAVQIQLAAFSAGYSDYDYASVRQLTATEFARGTVFTDDFARSDGYMGVTPAGLPWRFTDPVGTAEVIPKIVSGRVAMAKNASGTSAGYPYLDLGNGKSKSIHADLAWTGSGAACAMVSALKTGSRLTVTNILDHSVHIVFTDTKVDIGIGIGGGAITVLEAVNYAAPCATDGTNYPNVGWSVSGSTITITLPDQTTIQRTDNRFATLLSECAVVEPFYNTPAVGTLTYDNVAIGLA